MANQKEFVEVMGLIFEGKLNPVIDSVFPLDQASKGYQRLSDGKQLGKIIFKVD